MLSSVDNNHVPESLAHHALLYGSEGEFLAGTIPFIRDGLDRDEPIRIVTTSRNAGWLRAALGADADRMAFCDSSEWYLHPVRALAAVCHAVQVAGVAGQRLRMIGEPWGIPHTGQESREWARYESLVNTALAAANVAFVCTYNVRAVEPEVVAAATRTHPELVDSGVARVSPDYVVPATFSAECDRFPLPEPPHSAKLLGFDRMSQLSVLRAFVAFHAEEAGARTPNMQRFMLAVHEVATNAILHGGGSGVLRFWTERHTMTCEVSDSGPGLGDRLAGQLPPGDGGGCGLWLARQLCDLLEVRSAATGTTVRLRETLR